MALIPGTRLGPYEVTALIGVGGMGEVYRARDTKLDRDVAIKILPEAFAHDTERLARFQREAKTLASLNHPNIAAIHGLEESGGITALVMELVEGDDLSQRIARGAIPIDEALPIAKQIAEALEAAHEQGIIHRDLKPANIKVRSDGTVKVLDFGLAKAMEPVGAMSPVNSMSPTITTPAMTQAGMILGTAAYMSPEQARGKTVDKRADIWAFGAVLFEMLTGQRAFDGEDVSDTLAAVLRGQPDWSILPTDLPYRMHTLIERCLQRDLKKRIGDISTALFVIDEPTPAVARERAVAASLAAPRSLWRRAAPVVVGAVLAGALVGAVAWIFRAAPSPAIVTRFAVTLGDGQQFTADGRRLLAISADGTRVAYVANSQLYLRPMSDSVAKPIPGTAFGGGGGVGALNPVFSPDGRSIAFWTAADGTIKRISIDGGTAQTVCPAERPWGLNWDDADWILFGQGTAGIVRVPASGGKPETIVKVGDGELADTPQMLPDGETLLYTVTKASGPDRWDRATVVTHSLKSGERKTLVDGGSAAQYLSTGHIAYAVGGTLFVVPLDLGRMEVTGQPVPVVEGIRRASVPEENTSVAHFSVSKIGSLIFVPGPAPGTAVPRELVRVDVKGATRTLPLPPGRYGPPRVSPDGTRLAVGIDDGREADVWIYDLSGASSMRRLTFGGRNRFPVWSADGQRVAFQSDREGDLGIFWQAADGSATPQRLTKPPTGSAQTPESWSAGNQQLLLATSRFPTTALWVFSAATQKAAQLAGVEYRSLSLTRAAFSPDGRWFAYNAPNDQGVNVRVLVQPFPATGAVHQVGGGRTPLWSRDGRSLYYVDGQGRLVRVSVSTAAGVTFGVPEVVQSATLDLENSLGAEKRFDIAPDGSIFGLKVVPGAASTDAARIEVVLNWQEELKRLVPTP